jgi:hypothetical protein
MHMHSLTKAPFFHFVRMNASACINFSFVLSEMIITLGSVRRPIDFEKIIFDRVNLITHSALQSNFTPGLRLRENV